MQVTSRGVSITVTCYTHTKEWVMAGPVISYCTVFTRCSMISTWTGTVLNRQGLLTTAVLTGHVQLHISQSVSIASVSYR